MRILALEINGGPEIGPGPKCSKGPRGAETRKKIRARNLGSPEKARGPGPEYPGCFILEYPLNTLDSGSVNFRNCFIPTYVDAVS